MNTLVFINGWESFHDYDSYLRWLTDTYVTWNLDPWEEKPEKWQWKQAIAKKFTDRGWSVFLPQMPPLNAKYNEWKAFFEAFFTRITETQPIDQLSLIGHSLGGCFLMKYFSEKNIVIPSEKIHMIALVAPCLEEWDFTMPENFEFLRNFQNIHLFHADDDLVVPIKTREKIMEKIPNIHPHFFEASYGYKHFFRGENLEEFRELETVIFPDLEA